MSEADYLSVNISNDEFYQKLKSHIQSGTPLSFSRFGDGEISYLNRHTPNRFRQRYCQNFGYRWPQDRQKAEDEAHKILCSALKGTDIIGLLDRQNTIVNNKKLKYDPKVWSISKSFLSGLGIENIPIVADHQITRGQILGDVNQLKHILQGQPIHIISSRTTSLKENKLDQLLGVAVSYTHVDYDAPMTYRAKLFSEIDQITEKIVIVALGVMGKDIPMYLKNKGKICLDFGATIDAWSGHATRPWFKKGGVQDHCTIHSS